MRFYRVAQELLWLWMWERIAAAAADQMQQAAALRLATSFMFGYVDAALNRAEQVYEAEREICCATRPPPAPMRSMTS